MPCTFLRETCLEAPLQVVPERLPCDLGKVGGSPRKSPRALPEEEWPDALPDLEEEEWPEAVPDLEEEWPDALVDLEERTTRNMPVHDKNITIMVYWS